MQDGEDIPWEEAQQIYDELYNVLFPNIQSLKRIAERGGFGYKEVECMKDKIKEKNNAKSPIHKGQTHAAR